MASDPKHWVWERARTILSEAERIEREFLRVRSLAPDWAPAVDVWESAAGFWILVAVPGVAPESIEVTLAGSRLTVCGVRDVPVALRGAAVQRMEIPRGRFERRVDLPSGRLEIARREAYHGCLVLNLRKR